MADVIKRPVVLVERPRAGEGQLVRAAVIEQVGVDEFAPVVRVDAQDGKGNFPLA